MNRSTFILALSSASLLSACTFLAPTYQRPTAPVPAQWPTGPAYDAAAPQATPTSAAQLGWQDFILDDKLKALINMALENNRDLRIAVLNITKARAQYSVTRSSLFPSIDASISGNHTKTGKDQTLPSFPQITHNYSAGIGFSAYELDFFGRMQNLSTQAMENYLATESARDAAQITLIAEVASAYFTLGADQKLLQLAQATLINQKSSYKLIKQRFMHGIASQVDLSQAQTNLNAAQIALSNTERQVAQDQNALTLLVGKTIPPQWLPTDIQQTDKVLKAVPVGLSSDVLLNRPDISAAEHTLKGDNANIGAARAAFFPSITLTAQAGVGSNQLSSLFQGGNSAWSFVPQLSLPIFSGGYYFGQLKLAKAQRDIDIAQYEKTIQTAFRETADALAQRSTAGEQLKAQQALTNASALASQLAEARYKTGMTSYLEALEAQLTLYQAQKDLVNIQLGQQTSWITLYKALGGGVQRTEDRAHKR